MGIKLNDPIKLCLEEIDIDNYLPSIQFNLKVMVKQFSCLLEYNGKIWIECANWDVFVSNLKSLEKICILKDMNNSFLLKIIKTAEGAEFLWSVSYENIQKATITVDSKMNISNDLLTIIKEEFSNFPKWW